MKQKKKQIRGTQLLSKCALTVITCSAPPERQTRTRDRPSSANREKQRHTFRCYNLYPRQQRKNNSSRVSRDVAKLAESSREKGDGARARGFCRQREYDKQIG